MTVAFIRTGSLPLRVLELATDNVAGRTQDRPLAGQHFGERLCGEVGADDPDHGEAAHGLVRGDAARCRERQRFDGTKLRPLAPANRRIIRLARARTSRTRIESSLDAVLDGRSLCLSPRLVRILEMT